MKATPRTLLCIGILILFAVWPVAAQEKQSQDTDLLRAKIEQFEKTELSSKSSSVQSIYQRTLLRLYEQFSSALQQDIADLKAMQSAVSGTNSESQKEIVNKIQRLMQEQDENTERIQTLRGDLRTNASTEHSTPNPVSTTPETQFTNAVFTRPRTKAASATPPDTSTSIAAMPATDSFANKAAAAPDIQTPVDPPDTTKITAPKEGDTKLKGSAGAATKGAKVIAHIEGVGVNPSAIANSDGSFTIFLSSALMADREIQFSQEVNGALSLLSPALTTVKKADAPVASKPPSKDRPVNCTNDAFKKAFPLLCPQRGLTGLLLGGVVVSQQEKNFSQADPFFGFIAGYNSTPKGGGGVLHYRVQGIFQVQPQTATAPKATGSTPTTPTPVNPADFTPFLASRKTFDIDTHLWMDYPLGPGLVRVGPYIGVGASTFIDKNELKGDETVTKADTTSGADTKLDPSLGQASNDLKRYYEGGVIANFLRTDGKLFMTTQFLYGNYEALAGLVPGHDTRNRFVGRLRIFPTGIKVALSEDPNDKGVSMAPMFGVELNAGRGPDQLKFFTGIAISITKFKPFAPPEKTDTAPTTTSGGTTPQ